MSLIIRQQRVNSIKQNCLSDPSSTFFVGVEVEVEFSPGSVPDLNEVPHGWTVTEDRSLRNGLEFVSRIGLSMREISSSLPKLYLYLNRGEPIFSWRTSCHVHVNAESFSENDLTAVSLLYVAYEDSLFNFVHPSRKSSNFCIPLTWGLSPISGFRKNYGKYSALNFESLNRHGTLEFRHLEGCADYNRVLTWLKIIERLIRYARRCGPKVLAKQFKSLEPKELHEKVFGSEALIAAPTQFDLIQSLSLLAE